MYDYEVGELLTKMRKRFHGINEDKNLTEADEKQLKDFYLHQMIAPRLASC